jgi:hypothetical protein
MLMLINHQASGFFFLFVENNISYSFLAGGYNANSYGSPPGK